MKPTISVIVPAYNAGDYIKNSRTVITDTLHTP